MGIIVIFPFFVMSLWLYKQILTRDVDFIWYKLLTEDIKQLKCTVISINKSINSTLILQGRLDCFQQKDLCQTADRHKKLHSDVKLCLLQKLYSVKTTKIWRKIWNTIKTKYESSELRDLGKKGVRLQKVYIREKKK